MTMTTESRGFTLLEVIVALAILAMCVTVLMRIFATASSHSRTSHDYYQAMEVAETQMALLTGVDNPPGFSSGTIDDSFRWESRVSEFRGNPVSSGQLYDGLFDSSQEFVPYLYQVKVRWGDRKKRQVSLSTIRLGEGR